MYLLAALVVLLAIFSAFRSRRIVNAGEEQAVILKLKLASGQMGGSDERERVHVLEDHLADSIKRSAAGEFDGDEYGDGYCTIYMYGTSAEALFRAIQPVLNGYPAHAGSYALKRYGKPGSRQDRIPLGGH
ncbi:MAG TPA: hypothetical protein VME18_13785 [Acidobacteriaceae bacterium]|nr:hypothetical protein [Acidobacteriaceae bacterium]